MKNWDYDLPRNWKPQTPEETKWYLVRKINYGDIKGLDAETVRKYFPAIKTKLDPGKRALFEDFLWNSRKLKK